MKIKEVYIHYRDTSLTVPILYEVLFNDGKRALFGADTAPSDLKNFDPEAHFLAGVVGWIAIWYW